MECYSEECVSNAIGVKKPVLLIDEEQVFLDEARAESRCFLGEEYPFWGCHFVNNPVMPGTYMLEMLAQSAAFFEMKLTNCLKVPIITSITNVRFLRELKPGQVVVGEIGLKKKAGCYYTIQGKLICEEKLVCKAEMVHYIKG